jgi:hypothetical protein
LPHADRIQASFGPDHDVSSVQAHVGGPAEAACSAMGAVAYATGTQVAFKSAPDLHTAAHETAHVVQQRAGVSLKDNVGQTGDVHERHADAVADRVVHGESAADLLALYTGGGGGSSVQARAQAGSAPVQRRVWVGGRDTATANLVIPPSGMSEQDGQALLGKSAGQVAFEDAWTQVRAALCAFLQVSSGELESSIEERVRAKLVAWRDQISAIENKLRHKKGVAPQDNQDMASYTEQRVYPDWSGLAAALFHESDSRYERRVAKENELAELVKADGQYTAAVTAVVQALVGSLSPEQLEELAMLAVQSRYGPFSQLARAKALASGGDMSSMVILLDEYTELSPVAQSAEFKKLKMDMRSFGDFRTNGWTVNESNEWVRSMRKLGAPLQAGPSGTTNRVLTLARMLGCSGDVVGRVAWVMFAFFNGMWRGQSGTHRLVEVMAVAQEHCGEVWNYRPSSNPGATMIEARL